jgi:uncharacterized protein involved in exopolysaccharide biosynthesis
VNSIRRLPDRRNRATGWLAAFPLTAPVLPVDCLWLLQHNQSPCPRFIDILQEGDVMVSRNGHSAIVRRSSRSALQDFLGAFYRHQRKMAVVFCGTLALLVVGVLLFPRAYTSEARLFLRLGKESVTLDPTATTNDVINVNESREGEINSELEILRARVLLEDVVENLGADDVLSHESKKGWLSTLIAPLVALKTLLAGDVGPTEKAVIKLQKTLVVTSPKKSNVVLIKCKANDPARAQRILSTFVSAYLVRHGQANRTVGSYEFFVDQSELLHNQLTKVQEELRDDKNLNGLLSIEGQRDNLEEQANLIEIARLENERALASSDQKIAAFRALLADLPQHELAEEAVMPNSAADNMRNELYKVQIFEQEARARFTDAHPHVIALRRQVDEMRKILTDEEANRSQPTHKLSEVHQSVEIDLIEAQATAAAQRAEAVALDQQLAALQVKVRALNDQEMRIAELGRKADLTETAFRTYTTNCEQARINAALESGRISNVNVVQPASLSAKPSSPSLSLGFALALVLATSASILVALVSDQLDRSLKSPNEIEQALEVPVLFSIPRGTRHAFADN